MNDIGDESKSVGYLNPALVSKSMQNPKINKNREEYKGKSAKEIKAIEKKFRNDARSCAATYIGRCMFKWKDRTCISAAYNFK